jgi:hypothetical protein
MSNTKAKLISDIRQAFITQATKHSNSTTAPVSSAITDLSTKLGTSIINYVDFFPVIITAYTIGNSRDYRWLTNTNNTSWSIASNSTSTPSGNSIINAALYAQTINITSGGSGNLDSKVWIDRGGGDWFMIARAQIYNSLFAIIPAGYPWAVSFTVEDFVGDGAAQANITIYKAGK